MKARLGWLRLIGNQIALRLESEGASVVVVDIDQVTADETCRLMKHPENNLAITCDVASSKDVAQVMAQVTQRYGRLDILVNNAGVGTVPGDAFEAHKLRRQQYLEQVGRGEKPTIFPDRIIDMEDRGFWKLMEINLGGTFYFCREATRLMIAAESPGSIINIASTSALSGEGAVHYASAKAAMLGLTKSLARELAPRHIRVNAVCPGPTNTTRISALGATRAQALIEGTLINRLCEPNEIAATVAFLASDEGTAFTGQTLAANGGSYLL
ncbi:SDR family NAD(P)-dependent oxidoreductase [Denitratisoma oestradiolicum]|nr:SDR family oxidoreductase [Denitratisoma oestradiolicum]TWO79133.1 hypothetical protein CBW56_16515 [Denitratisoma oestradiolicum]